MTDSAVLSPVQVEDFRRDGYVVVPGLYAGRDLDLLRAWVEEVANYPEVPGRYMMYFEDSLDGNGERLLSRIEDFVPYHEGLAGMIQGRMRAAVSQLFGEEAVLFKDKINFKLPGGDGYRAHQDVQAGWDDYAPLHVTAMVAVDECNAENGALEMLPGWHQRGVVGSRWEPLTDADTDGAKYVRVDTAPGDAVFFDSFAPHRSGPNRSSRPRQILYVTYNRLSDGDHRRQYYADKRRNYPPDCERVPGREYRYHV